MIASPNNNEVEFIGNVKVTKGATIIVSDNFKVYYDNSDKDSKGNKEITASEDSIKKIVAYGKVTIWFDNKIAKTEKAVYTKKTEILELIGVGSSLTSNKNSISGSKIIFYRKNEHIIVESSKKERVEAVFYSETSNE